MVPVVRCYFVLDQCLFPVQKNYDKFRDDLLSNIYGGSNVNGIDVDSMWLIVVFSHRQLRMVFPELDLILSKEKI